MMMLRVTGLYGGSQLIEALAENEEKEKELNEMEKVTPCPHISILDAPSI